MERRGQLIYMWECDWELYMADNPEIEDIETQFPNVMKREQTEIGLINQIKEGSFFGYVHCDLW